MSEHSSSADGLSGNERIVAEAFERAAAQAKGTPPETPPTQDAPHDHGEVAQGRERDPATGQFRRRDELQAEPDSSQDLEQAEAPVPDEDDLGELRAIYDRYGGDQKKLLAALAEKESMIGRLGSELGELRQVVERVDQRQQAWEDEPEPFAPPQIDHGQFSALVYRSPREALAFAIQNGHGPDTPLYTYALEQWADSGDPKDAFEAAQTDYRIRLELYKAESRQEIERMYAPVQQQIQQQQVASTWNQAFLEVAAKTPDINDLLPAIGDIAQSSSTFKRALMEAPSVQEKARIIEEMVHVARGRSIPSIKNAAAEARQQAEDEGRAQRTQAFVASGSSANREPPVSRSDMHKSAIMSAVHGLLSPGTREAA